MDQADGSFTYGRSALAMTSNPLANFTPRMIFGNGCGRRGCRLFRGPDRLEHHGERGLVGAASVRAHGTVTPVANGLSMGFMVAGTG